MPESSRPGTQSLREIAEYHEDTTNSLRLYFSTSSVRVSERYLSSTEAEISKLLATRLQETDLRSCLAILSSIEAALRIDYEVRCSAKLKDPLSRAFRNLYKRFGNRVRLEDDILRLWSEHHPALKTAIRELRGALKFRHWLAHGRHGELTRGRKYDFTEVFVLASVIDAKFPLVRV